MQLSAATAWPKVARRFVREYQNLIGQREREICGVRIRSMSARPSCVKDRPSVRRPANG